MGGVLMGYIVGYGKENDKETNKTNVKKKNGKNTRINKKKRKNEKLFFCHFLNWTEIVLIYEQEMKNLFDSRMMKNCVHA